MFKVGDRVRVNGRAEDKELEGLETTIILEDPFAPAIDVTEFYNSNPGTFIGWHTKQAGTYGWHVSRGSLDLIPTTNPKPNTVKTGEEKMKKIALKAGVAVLYVAGMYSCLLANRVGKVISERSAFRGYLVDFGEGFMGHDGNGIEGFGTGQEGTLWWCCADELAPVILPEFSHSPAGKAGAARSTTGRSTKGRVRVDASGKRVLPPQAGKVLALLKEKGSLTPLEAAGVYRVRSLSRRIVDLKEAGYTIVTKLSKDVTGQRYARYYLKGDAPQAAVLAAA